MIFLNYMRCVREKKIEFSASFFNIDDLSLATKLNLKRIKIPSGEITNYPLLKKVGSLGKKIILSTGMSNLEEIRKAFDLIVRSGTKKKNISLLHCNTEYPTPLKDVNLRAIKKLRKYLKLKLDTLIIQFQ